MNRFLLLVLAFAMLFVLTAATPRVGLRCADAATCCCRTYGGGLCCAEVAICTGGFVPGCYCSGY